MAFRVVLTDEAKRGLRKIPEDDRREITYAMRTSLAYDPFSGKKLEADWEGYYSLRVWPYRIIYRIQKNIVTVTVFSIGHRKDIYRRA